MQRIRCYPVLASLLKWITLGLAVCFVVWIYLNDNVTKHFERILCVTFFCIIIIDMLIFCLWTHEYVVIDKDEVVLKGIFGVRQRLQVRDCYFEVSKLLTRYGCMYAQEKWICIYLKNNQSKKFRYGYSNSKKYYRIQLSYSENKLKLIEQYIEPVLIGTDMGRYRSRQSAASLLSSEMFYFDEALRGYEENFQWIMALNYLEEKLFEKFDWSILNSLVGFAWFYYIKVKENNQSDTRQGEDIMRVWKKYVDYGIDTMLNPYFAFIAGYTLTLHGFYLDDKFQGEYQIKGEMLIYKCLDLAEGTRLKKFASHFLKMNNVKKYVPLKADNKILQKLFGSESLLGQYFIKLYS